MGVEEQSAHIEMALNWRRHKSQFTGGVFKRGGHSAPFYKAMPSFGMEYLNLET